MIVNTLMSLTKVSSSHGLGTSKLLFQNITFSPLKVGDTRKKQVVFVQILSVGYLCVMYHLKTQLPKVATIYLFIAICTGLE